MALFSRRNIGKNTFNKTPLDFFKDIDKNFERTGPFVVKLISKSKQIEDRVLFICEAGVDIKKILNTFHHLKVKFPGNINYSIEYAKESGYFIAIFSYSIDKTELYMYMPQINTILNGIGNYTFGDYEYISNPDDPKELEYIYSDFIKQNLNS